MRALPAGNSKVNLRNPFTVLLRMDQTSGASHLLGVTVVHVRERMGTYEGGSEK
jgi:hypothetical protein